MLKRLVLAAALAAGFSLAATAAPAPAGTALPDNLAVAFTKHGGGHGHHGWRGRGRHLGWYKHHRHPRHYGWSRGRHRGWR
jgi:hypothetical protein